MDFDESEIPAPIFGYKIAKAIERASRQLPLILPLNLCHQ